MSNWNSRPRMKRKRKTIFEDCLFSSLLSTDHDILEDFQELVIAEFPDVSTTDFEAKQKTCEADSRGGRMPTSSETSLLSRTHKTPAEHGDVQNGRDFKIIRQSFGLEVEVIAGV